MILGIKTENFSAELILVFNNKQKRVIWEGGRNMAEQIPARIRDFLAANAATYQELTGIIIFAGPGSFTSLRIGHTVANVIADGLGIPVVSTQGEQWFGDGIDRIRNGQNDVITMPFYGSEPNITKPRN